MFSVYNRRIAFLDNRFLFERNVASNSIAKFICLIVQKVDSFNEKIEIISPFQKW